MINSVKYLPIAMNHVENQLALKLLRNFQVMHEVMNLVACGILCMRRMADADLSRRRRDDAVRAQVRIVDRVSFQQACTYTKSAILDRASFVRQGALFIFVYYKVYLSLRIFKTTFLGH